MAAKTDSNAPVAPYPAAGNVNLLDLYRAVRLARLNDKYYGESLASTRRLSVAVDLTSAIAASSSVIAAVSAAAGKGSAPVVVLSVVAALIAAVKPVLNLSARVDRYARVWSGWHGIATALKRLCADVEAHEGWRKELTPLYIDLADRMDRLASDDDSSPAAKVVRRLTDEVNRELPADRFWMPVEAEEPAAAA